MSTVFYARAAYGRDANIADWDEGKDFRSINGSYFSIRDVDFLRASGYDRIVALRNDGVTEFTVLL